MNSNRQASRFCTIPAQNRTLHLSNFLNDLESRNSNVEAIPPNNGTGISKQIINQGEKSVMAVFWNSSLTIRLILNLCC